MNCSYRARNELFATQSREKFRKSGDGRLVRGRDAAAAAQVNLSRLLGLILVGRQSVGSGGKGWSHLSQREGLCVWESDFKPRKQCWKLRARWGRSKKCVWDLTSHGRGGGREGSLLRSLIPTFGKGKKDWREEGERKRSQKEAPFQVAFFFGGSTRSSNSNLQLQH